MELHAQGTAGNWRQEVVTSRVEPRDGDLLKKRRCCRTQRVTSRVEPHHLPLQRCLLRVQKTRRNLTSLVEPQGTSLWYLKVRKTILIQTCVWFCLGKTHGFWSWEADQRMLHRVLQQGLQGQPPLLF